MRVDGTSCCTKTSALLCAGAFYIGLIAAINLGANFVGIYQVSDVAYATPFLIFAALGFSSIRFFRANKRNYSPDEKSFLFWWFFVLNAAVYLIGIVAFIGQFAAALPLSFFILPGMFALDVVSLSLTLRYIWSIYILE